MPEIDVRTAKGWLDAGEAQLIDVRESDEFIAEHIKDSQLNCLSRFDPQSIKRDGKKILFLCRSGRRSQEALARFSAADPNAFSVAGGLMAWKQAGYEVTQQAKAPISIMRQVQIVAGSMVLLGTLLGLFVNPWFFFIPAFFGAGLVFSGVSGTCGMAAVLSLMPWNRAFRGCAME